MVDGATNNIDLMVNGVNPNNVDLLVNGANPDNMDLMVNGANPNHIELIADSVNSNNIDFMADRVHADDVDIIQCDTSPLSAIHAPGIHTRKRDRSESEEDGRLQKVIMRMDRANDQRMVKRNLHEIFGQYVACELDGIRNPDLQRWAKQKITTVLYQAQSGEVARSPARIDTSSLL